MRYLLAFYFLILPFQWALAPAPGIDLAFIRVLSAITFLVWLADALLKKKVYLPLGLGSWALSSFLFLAILSALWSENASFALRKGLFLLSFFPLYFVLYGVVHATPKLGRFFAQALVLSATAMGIIAIFIFGAQFVFGVGPMVSFLSNILPWFLGGSFGEAVITHSSLLVNISGTTVLRASGFLPDPHMFAFFTGMVAPLALGLFLSDTKRDRRFLFACAILLIADLLTFSRGGYVGLIGGGAWMLFLSSTTVFTVKRLKLVLIGILLCGALLLSPIGGRLLSSFSEGDGSNQERIRLWRESVILIAEKPLLGVGLGNYSLRIKPGADYREPIYAHSQYLDIALELGLLGLILFVVSILAPLLRLSTLYRSGRDPWTLAVGSSLVVFLTHALFESPLFSVHVLPVLLLLIALGVSYKHEDSHA